MKQDPTPAQVRAARDAAGLSQAEAAALVHFKAAQRWSEIERGVSPMEPVRWELFRIKTGAHPDYGPLEVKL